MNPNTHTHTARYIIIQARKVEDKEKNLESNEREVTCHIQRSFSKIVSKFFSNKLVHQKAVG